MKAARPAVQLCCAVVVGEAYAFLGDTVNVRRLVAHHAAVIVADVPGTNIVAPDDEDVWLLFLLSRSSVDRTSPKDHGKDCGHKIGPRLDFSHKILQ